MADQIILAWTVDVAGSSFGPLQAVTALEDIELYTDETTDPVLGQLFGLTVADDSTTSDANSATRTLTLNMNNANSPTAPPPFPCNPITSTPPVLPYPLRSTRTLPGSFFVTLGLATVETTMTQIPSLAVGDVVQFLNQPGVFYTILNVVDATQITLDDPFTGTTGNTGAYKEIAAPCPLDFAAVYSSSDLDTNGVATVPAIPAGAGARFVELTYNDSSGAGPFTATAELTGKRPAPFEFEEVHGDDIAVILNLIVTSSGDFENSVGEITFVALSDLLPDLPPNLPLGTGVGATETTTGKTGTAYIPRTFKTMTDEGQLLIDRHLCYLPPSFFALAQKQESAPALEGDFLVTTNSDSVTTTEDQTAALSSGDEIEFAVQPGTIYTIDTVTDKVVKLTTAFSGIDTNNTGMNNTPNNNTFGSKGEIGDALQRKPTGARRVDPSPATPPSNAQLSGPLGQFVAPAVAAPPANPPNTVGPGTVPVPTFLSGLFTRTIQLGLAGVPITSATITFA
jgi:hypothetical protein